jgi:hypothetical protein
MPTPFLGMRGTGDFTVTGQRPENWREMILYLYPNGKAPLTALMSMMKSEKTDDPKFHWFELELPNQYGAITALFAGPGLTNAYTGSGAAASTLIVQMAAADAAKFNQGHQVLLTCSTNPSIRINGYVSAAVVINGASSYVTLSLLQADNATNYQTMDTLMVIGTANAEGAGIPTALMYDPNELNNQTHIFRNSLDQTRTAQKTRLRTGDQVKEAKRQALEMHSIEMEKAFWFSYPSTTTGSNGKPMRTTKGIRNFLSTNVHSFVSSMSEGTPGDGSWLQGGEVWLEARLEELFRYGNTEKIGFCGSGALLGIQQLVKVGARIEIAPRETSYGIAVVTWVTPFGTLNLKLHPLFTLNPALRNSIGILDAPFLNYRYIDDTKYLPNRQAPDIDGEKSEFLTEAGLELHFEKAHGWLDGIGQSN